MTPLRPAPLAHECPEARVEKRFVAHARDHCSPRQLTVSIQRQPRRHARPPAQRPRPEQAVHVTPRRHAQNLSLTLTLHWRQPCWLDRWGVAHQVASPLRTVHMPAQEPERRAV